MRNSQIIGLIILLTCLISPNLIRGQKISILSWNLMDFGKSKSDSELNIIANTVMGFDIILIQEVVAKDIGGAQAVGKLANMLNDKGYKWDYRISDPTSGENSYKRERYAYLWKPSKVTLIGRPWLEIKYQSEIDREPYFATFKIANKEFTLVNYHAITKDKQPETEVKYFKLLPEEYTNLNLIFCGDFNLPQSHSVFNPLKAKGYLPALINQKTTLKRTCDRGDCLYSEFDNVFYLSKKVKSINSGVIHFYKLFSNFKDATKLTDHVPIFFEFSLN